MSQAPFQYVPGPATALASASVGILLGVDADHPAVDGLIEALDHGAGVDDLLDVLLRGGLRLMPDFACAEVTDAGVRVVARGGFTAATQAGDTIGAVSGPWVDAVVLGASVVLRGPDAVAGRRMPFQGGVVLAAELVVTATDTRAELPARTAVLPFDLPPQATESGVGLIEGRPSEPPPAVPEAPPHGVREDLDSWTVNRTQVLGADAAPPMVLAVRCSHGHLNPAFAAVCRVCRTTVPQQQPFETPRPTLGVLRLSTGAIVPLDRGAVLGRNPRVPADHRGARPNLVKVVDPGRDLSGQHLEVALDAWNVVVRDLRSTNGTEVVVPGELPVALAPNQPMILEPGSKVVMAGTVSFVFEATS